SSGVITAVPLLLFAYGARRIRLSTMGLLQYLAPTVQLALGAGSANAQGKFEVRLGGDAVFEGAYIDQNRDASTRSTEFFDRFRLNITAMAKADNGLTYGGRIRIRTTGGTGGSNAGTDVDRAYIQVGGAFGTVKMGTMNSYNDDIGAVYWPIAYQTGPLLLNDRAPNYASAVSSTTSTGATQSSAISSKLTPYSLTDNNNASKIVYMTPRMSGFQVGASYTPRNDSSSQDVNRNDYATAVGTGVPAFADVWELGLNYKGEFSGVGIQFGGGYMAGSAVDTANTTTVITNRHEDLAAWQVGGQVSYAGVSFGVGYINKGDSGLVSNYGNKKDLQVIGVGLQYETGPLTVGASYTHGEGNGFNVASRQIAVTGTGTSARTGYAGSVKQDYWSVGALYAVAPGLLVGGEYAYIDANAPGTASDDKANVFILRSALVF
ncbi:porin, partial [bacterium]|nr:porin [bacterium]